MQWNKAGRPAKRPQQEKLVEEKQTQQIVDKPWTRGEMRVHSDPIKALASAVIKQWKKDGKPKSDEKIVMFWASVIQEDRR